MATGKFQPPPFVRTGESPLLPPGEVQVWVFALPAVDAIDRGWPALTTAELEQARRISNARVRNRFLASSTALREVLGLYLGQAPQTVALQKRGGGKPALLEPEEAWLRFNLTHTHHLMLVACCRDIEVGVDAEWARPRIEADAIVHRFFSPAERLEWAAIDEARRPAAFLRGWTSKEAYAKGLGAGLRHPTDAYTVRLDPDRPPALLADQLRPGAEQAWTLHPLTVPAGCTAILAAGAAGFRIRMRGDPDASSPVQDE